MEVFFEISHDVKGTFRFDEPEGWMNAVLTSERHPDFYCLNEYFKSPMNMYGKNITPQIVVDGFRDWVIDVEEEYGPNAILRVTVGYKNHEFDTKKTLFKGQAPIVLLSEILDIDHTVEVAFAADDFWAKFLAGFQKEVDILSPTDKQGNAVSVLTPKNLKRHDLDRALGS